MASRLLLGGFLIAHGFVHPWLWAFPSSGSAPPQGESWLLHGVFGLGSTAQSFTAALAWFATIVFMAAGLMLLLGTDAWRIPAVVASVASLAVIALDFKPGLTIGLVLSAGIIWASVGPHWPVTRVVEVT